MNYFLYSVGDYDNSNYHQSKQHEQQEQNNRLKTTTNSTTSNFSKHEKISLFNDFGRTDLYKKIYCDFIILFKF